MRSGKNQHTAETLRARRERGDDKALWPPLSPRSSCGAATEGLPYDRFVGLRAPSRTASPLFSSLRFLRALHVSAVSRILTHSLRLPGPRPSSWERVG